MKKTNATEKAPAKEIEGIDWTSYASKIDLLAELMPAYSENVNSLLEHIKDRRLDGKVRLLDLGAGTGNFSLAMAQYLPEAEIIHVDSDPRMNEIAREKYERAGITNIEVIQEHIQRLDLPEASFDLIVCVNVLYALQPQEAIVQRIKNWLKPNGTFFVIDFGRKQSAIDWGAHFLWNAVKGRKVRKYFEFLLFGQEITRQALRGRKSQENGQYWMHSTQEFGDFLESTGFDVRSIAACQRNYADLAICGRRSALESTSHNGASEYPSRKTEKAQDP